MARAKAVPVAFELTLQLMEVVDLAVGDHLDVAAFVENGLLSGSEIDNGEAAHAEADAGKRDAPFFVGTAMVQHAHHPLEILRRYRTARVLLNDSNDSAHM